MRRRLGLELRCGVRHAARIAVERPGSGGPNDGDLRASARCPRARQEGPVLDVVVGVTFGAMFALAMLYVTGCDALRGGRP